MSNFFSKAADFFSGGLGSAIVDGVKSYFPPSMTDKEKAELSEKIVREANLQANEAARIVNEERAEFNQRIKDMEGTANDLKSISFFGPIVIFLRGCQRPVWGYATLYMDFMVFSGNWSKLSEMQESALWVINLLVLGFLFGERAIKNVMPLVAQYFKGGNKNGMVRNHNGDYCYCGFNCSPPCYWNKI